MFKNRKVFLTVVVVALAAAGVAYYVLKDDTTQNSSETQTSEDPTQDEQTATTNDANNNQTDNQTDENDTTLPEDPKTPPVTVSEKPIVSSSYGLVSSKPIKQGSVVSTSCSTDARVECTLTFTNTSTGEIVTFDAQKTDAQGVTIWEWSGGTDLPSGTWKSVASAGDKSSTPEVIYVQ